MEMGNWKDSDWEDKVDDTFMSWDGNNFRGDVRFGWVQVP